MCSSLIGWHGCLESPLHHMIVVAVDVGRSVSNPQIGLLFFCLSKPATCIVVSGRGTVAHSAHSTIKYNIVHMYTGRGVIEYMYYSCGMH